MKHIVLSNETVQAILNKLDAFATDKNKLSLEIGIANVGDGLACKAIIVNGGMMGAIGFKTLQVPKDYTKEATIYFKTHVSASALIGYLKSAMAFNENIQLYYDEKEKLTLKVGKQVNVTIPTFPEGDKLLSYDSHAPFVLSRVDTQKFLNAIKTGAFLSSANVDERGITDRVALKFAPNEITVYSTDSKIVSKSWCEATVQISYPNICAAFLVEKTSKLSGEDKNSLIKKIKEVSTSAEETVKLAKEEGFQEAPHMLALQTACMNTIRSIFAGSDTLDLLATANHLVIKSGNVLATFCIAGKATELYVKSVDPWQQISWTSQCVVDKETLVNALSIIRLSNTLNAERRSIAPFLTTCEVSNMIVQDRQKNTVKVPIVASKGELLKTRFYLDVEKVLQVLSKLSNGNLIIRFFEKGPNGSVFPISFSNGDLEGNGTQSYTYIFTVNVPAEEEITEEKPAAVSPQQESSEKKEDIPDLPEENVDDVINQ